MTDLDAKELTSHVESQPDSKRLPLTLKLAFGIGASAEVFYLGMFNTFIGIFYNQALGLSNSLVGLAIMLSLVVDAISDPVVGIVSDRWRSKLGRRHPFLFFAPIPLAISIYLIFNPPDALLGEIGSGGAKHPMLLFGWLVSLTVLSRLSITLYIIPHLALGAELTRDHNERSVLFSYNSVFGYAIGAMFAYLAWGYFLAGTAVNANGDIVPSHLDAGSYSPLVLTACGVAVVTIWLSAIGTLQAAKKLSQPILDQSRIGILTFGRQMISLLRLKNYRVLVLGVFFFMLASGLYETFNTFVQTFFWELMPEDLKWFGLVSIPGAIMGALFAPLLMRRFDRKPVLIGNLIALVVFVQLPVDLRILDLMPDNKSSFLLPLLLVNVGCFSFTVALGSVAILSMLGDTIDENELNTGGRDEGLFYSARTFIGKAASSMGYVVAGFTLDFFVRLPFGAVPGEVSGDVIFRLGIAAGPMMGIAAIISILFYSRYDLSRERHNQILKELGNRN